MALLAHRARRPVRARRRLRARGRSGPVRGSPLDFPAAAAAQKKKIKMRTPGGSFLSRICFNLYGGSSPGLNWVSAGYAFHLGRGPSGPLVNHHKASA